MRTLSSGETDLPRALKRLINMKTLLRIVGVATGLLLVTGCASPKPTVSFATSATQLTNATYAIGPFVDGNAEKDRATYPNAAAVVAAAFEDALMESGRQTVGLGEEDITVSGVVTAYWQGKFWGRDSTVGFNVRAVEKKTGIVLWTASHSRTPRWEYDLPPGLLAREVACEIVKQIVAAGKRR